MAPGVVDANQLVVSRGATGDGKLFRYAGLAAILEDSGPGSNAPAGVGSESSTTPAFASAAVNVSISSTNASAEAPTSGGICVSVS